eukprot:COSAG01_NODE_10492_length_2152_cov_2.259440_3_plen_136_part_00
MRGGRDTHTHTHTRTHTGRLLHTHTYDASTIILYAARGLTVGCTTHTGAAGRWVLQSAVNSVVDRQHSGAINSTVWRRPASTTGHHKAIAPLRGRSPGADGAHGMMKAPLRNDDELDFTARATRTVMPGAHGAIN